MAPAGTAHAPTEDLLPRSRERGRIVPNARILPPAAATLLVLSAAAAAPDAGRAQVALGPALEARVYYRAARDAYVAIFHIDTDGTSRLVFPRSPDEDHYVRGGRDYRLLFPLSPYWYVEDQPGVGYYFIVASFQRFDLSSFRFSHYDYGWDLSLVGRHVYRDLYLAMDYLRGRAPPGLGARSVCARLHQLPYRRAVRVPPLPLLRLPRVQVVRRVEPLPLRLHHLPSRDLRRSIFLSRPPLPR